MHRIIARDQGFQSSFVRQFNVNLRKCEKDVLEMVFTMKRDATYSDPFGAPSVRKPEVGSTIRFMEAARTHGACVHDTRGKGGGQGRVFNAGGPGGRADERKGGGWGEGGRGGIRRDTGAKWSMGVWGV